MAVETWTGCPDTDPDLSEIVRMMERLATPAKQCISTGHGFIEVRFKNKRVASVDWKQGLLFQ